MAIRSLNVTYVMKRNLSSGSEPEIKKKNTDSTPVKETVREMAENFDTEQQRSEKIRSVKETAPGWFSTAFDFILSEFSRIQVSAEALTKCSRDCDQNRKQINTLEQRVQLLEAENKNLSEQVDKLESYSRKPNLIFKGIP